MGEAPRDDRCEHENFGALVEVNRLQGRSGDTEGYKADITVTCTDCGEPFTWMGNLKVGALADEVTTDVTGVVLCAPLRPQSADPKFGMGIVGFAMRAELGHQESSN